VTPASRDFVQFNYDPVPGYRAVTGSDADRVRLDMPIQTLPASPHSSTSAEESSQDRIRPQPVVSSTSDSPDAIRPKHLLKTIGFALLLTGLFMLPQFLIHIPTGIIAPISAGITTGGVMKVRPWESLIIGVILFLVITIPAPAAYIWLEFANHLPFIAIFAFSFAFGLYYGTLIGLFSWLGSRINQSKIGA
jgi:hypothetical protein